MDKGINFRNQEKSFFLDADSENMQIKLAYKYAFKMYPFLICLPLSWTLGYEKLS